MLKTQNLDSYDNVCFVSYTAVFVLSLKLSTVENWYGGRNIFFFLEKRQRGRFAGFSLNVSNTDLKPRLMKTPPCVTKTALCYRSFILQQQHVQWSDVTSPFTTSGLINKPFLQSTKFTMFLQSCVKFLFLVRVYFSNILPLLKQKMQP